METDRTTVGSVVGRQCDPLFGSFAVYVYSVSLSAFTHACMHTNSTCNLVDLS